MNVPTQLMPPNTTIQPHYVMKNNIFILVKLTSVTFTLDDGDKIDFNDIVDFVCTK